MANKDEKTGILLLNLGGPDTQKAIKPFLYNLFSDREIIRLGPAPLQKPVAWLISTLRAGKTKKAYSLIGGGSPILPITKAQASALQRQLKGYGDFKVYIGMRYWRPFIEETVAEAERDGIKKLLALSLYPHYSKATTGSSENKLKEILKNSPLECSYVSSFYDHPLYIDALADVIEKGLQMFKNPPIVLFSAHSLPVKFIEEGDPYVEHIMGTIKAISKKIDINWRLAYQSKSGPVKWLEPSMEEMLEKLASEGIRDVLVVPISFVSDHIETLYEIDILYKGMAEKSGLRLQRTDSLNTHPLFIEALKGIVLENISKTS